MNQQGLQAGCQELWVSAVKCRLLVGAAGRWDRAMGGCATECRVMEGCCVGAHYRGQSTGVVLQNMGSIAGFRRKSGGSN